MSRDEVLSLNEEAQAAFARGDYQATLKCYVRLEQMQPDEPTWPRGSAVVFKRMGLMPQVVAALSRAARAYSDRSEHLKAAALCKQILTLDEKHRPTLELFAKTRASLQEDARARQSASQPKISPPPPSTTPAPRPQSWVQDSGARLEQLHLRKIMPGVTQMNRGPAVAGDENTPSVYQIPLHDEAQSHLELEPNLDTARPASHRALEEAAMDAVAAATQAAEEEVKKEDTVSSVIPATPLFADLGEESFERLLHEAKLLELNKDDVVFQQGSPGHALYVVAEGAVGVIDEGPPRRALAKLGEGDFFGEIALVTNQPRNATVVALRETQLIEVDLETIRALISTDPPVLTVLLRFFRNRLIDRLLSTNPMFATLSQRDRQALKGHFRFLEVEPGATLIAQGHRPEGLLMLLSGHAEVLRDEGGVEQRIGYLAAGDVAGEISLVTQQPAIASVRAGSKCFAIELPTGDFHKILHARPDAMEFIKQTVARRTAQASAIASGDEGYPGGGDGSLY